MNASRAPLASLSLDALLRALSERFARMPLERLHSVIAFIDAPTHVSGVPTAAPVEVPSLALRAAERAYEHVIARTLDVHDGNVSAAARALDMDRRKLERIMRRMASGQRARLELEAGT